MLSELPKLLGRGFAIGYFLPATLGLLGGIGVAAVTGSSTAVTLISSVGDVLDVAVLAGTIWLTAILLMALNRPIYRFYEGYAARPKWLVAVIGARSKTRYNSLRAELAELDKRYAEDRLFSYEAERRKAISLELVQEFPEDHYLLPTRFGNVLRAFESYSRLMYGLDDIPGWLRLTAVIPADYRSFVEDQKAITDFWLNLRVATTCVTLVALGIVTFRYEFVPAFLVDTAILAGFAAADTVLAKAARSAAVEWGNSVKAAYDVYLPKLREALGFPAPRSADEAVQHWIGFSRAILYRHRPSLPRERREYVLFDAHGRRVDSESL